MTHSSEIRVIRRAIRWSTFAMGGLIGCVVTESIVNVAYQFWAVERLSHGRVYGTEG